MEEKIKKNQKMKRDEDAKEKNVSGNVSSCSFMALIKFMFSSFFWLQMSLYLLFKIYFSLTRDHQRQKK